MLSDEEKKDVWRERVMDFIYLTMPSMKGGSNLTTTPVSP